MTKSQILCFTTAAEHLSFTKAADQLFISQPAVSKQISLLETELGFSLFERTPNGISLTSAGQVMYDFFTTCKKQYEVAVKESRRLSREHPCEVKIGCLEGWDISKFYVPLSLRLKEKYPSVRLTVEAFKNNQIIPALKSGEVDVIISLGTNLKGHSQISTKQLTSTRGVIIYSAHHPNAGKTGLTMADFKDDVFFIAVDPDTDKAHKTMIRKYCARYGFKPVIETNSNIVALLMKVQSGLGVFVAEDWVLSTANPNFGCTPTEIVYNIYAGWANNDQNPLKTILVNELTAIFKKQNIKSLDIAAVN